MSLVLLALLLVLWRRVFFELDLEEFLPAIFVCCVLVSFVLLYVEIVR